MTPGYKILLDEGEVVLVSSHKIEVKMREQDLAVMKGSQKVITKGEKDWEITFPEPSKRTIKTKWSR